MYTSSTSAMLCIWPDDGSMSRNMSPNVWFLIMITYICCVYWLIKLTYIIAKHNGMAPIKVWYILLVQQSLGATPKFWVKKRCRKAISLLRTQNSGVACKYTPFGRFLFDKWGLIYISCMQGETSCNNFVDNIARYRTELSHPVRNSTIVPYYLSAGDIHTYINYTCLQGRIKLFGATRQWKHFRPLFQAGFLSDFQTESNTTPPSPKTEITNILLYIWILHQ